MFDRCVIILKAVIIAALANLTIFTVPAYLASEESGIILRGGQIVNLVGEADIKKVGENIWTEASVGLLLSQYDMIRTRDGANVDIEFPKKDGQYFKIKIMDNSELSFTRLEYDATTMAENILLDLAIGDVLIKTDRLDPKSKFRVRTPTSMIGVRGTRFEVIYEKAKGV